MNRCDALIEFENSPFKFIKYDPGDDEIICSKVEIDKIYKDVVMLSEISTKISILLKNQNEDIGNIEDTTNSTIVVMEATKMELDEIAHSKTLNALSVISIGAGITLFSGISAIYGMGYLLMGTTGILGGIVGGLIIKTVK
jgi:hypothetical protein